MRWQRLASGAFRAGDLGAGAFVGAITAATVRAVVTPDMDMALAMLLGMGIGMAVHVPLGLLLSVPLGLFHVMVPTGLIGMYGGMLFAMRDTMQMPPHSMTSVLLVGAIFGLVVAAAVRGYDWILNEL